MTICLRAYIIGNARVRHDLVAMLREHKTVQQTLQIRKVKKGKVEHLL